MLAQQHYAPDTPWTIRNKDHVEVYRICKYHTAAKANLCAYGNQCRYIHYDQLHRPSLAEENAQQTLQQQILNALCSLNLVLTAILPLLNGLNTTADQSTALFEDKSPAQQSKRAFAPRSPANKKEDAAQTMETKEDHMMDEAKYDSDCAVAADDSDTKEETTDKAMNILSGTNLTHEHKHDNHNPYEDIIDAEVNLEDLRKDDFDWVNPSVAKQYKKPLQQSQIDLFKFLWANSKDDLLQVLPPQTLPDTYPKQLLVRGKTKKGCIETVFGD